MASPAVTYSFSNSTVADATQVNQNFTDIINGITDGTKDLSISALTCAGNVSITGSSTLTIASGKVNKVTITAPATGSTLTIADGASLITSGAYSMTLTATAATSVTLPTSGTLATTTLATSSANGLIAGSGTQTIGGDHNWSDQPTFSVRKSANQTSVGNGQTLCTWNTEDWDVGNNFGSNKFTAPTAGKYMFAIQMSGRLDDSSSLLYVRYRINGTGNWYIGSNVSVNVASATDVSVSGTRIFQMAAGDYIEAYIDYEGLGSSQPIYASGVFSDVDTFWQGWKIL